MIITLRIYVHGGETVFNYGEKMNDIRKIAHVLKHFHGRCVVGAFERSLHEGIICTVNISVLSFIVHK